VGDKPAIPPTPDVEEAESRSAQGARAVEEGVTGSLVSARMLGRETLELEGLRLRIVVAEAGARTAVEVSRAGGVCLALRGSAIVHVGDTVEQVREQQVVGFREQAQIGVTAGAGGVRLLIVQHMPQAAD
jgi:hypothetical protein